MPEKNLHIVSFNVPYPANYGGVQDVFYKLRALHAEGIKITLHCFDYGRGQQAILEQYCEKVFYYTRRKSVLLQFHYLPYIVASRINNRLLDNLLKDDSPILFEGLHCCYYMADSRLQNRTLIYRESNIEHHYYFNLAKAEKNIGKKLYFLLEGFKLGLFQAVLKHASLMLAVSETDTAYLEKAFPAKKVHYLPSFIAHQQVDISPGKGTHLLYHGDLSVPENAKAGLWLVREIFSKINYPAIIAGNKPGKALKAAIAAYPHIQLVESPLEEEMQRLLRDAQANVLVTFQATGLKLKLLNALYTGRFCVANSAMLAGTGLSETCIVADSADSMISAINNLLNKDFTQEDISKRGALLSNRYDNVEKARRLIRWVYKGN